MSQRFIVRASLLPGYNHYFRAGRGWSANATEIELVDQDDDPMLPNPKPGLPEVAHPTQVGRKSFTILEKDPRISIKTVGEESSEAMAAQLPGLQLELSKATAKIAELEAAREHDASSRPAVPCSGVAVQPELLAGGENAGSGGPDTLNCGVQVERVLQSWRFLPNALSMSPKDAITAHVNWKLRIHALLSGKLEEKLEPATIARDNVCELGKWIYGEGKGHMAADAHADLTATHAAFHKEAARIVGEVYAGHKIGLEAIEMSAPFGKLTTRIVGILSKMDKK